MSNTSDIYLVKMPNFISVSFTGESLISDPFSTSFNWSGFCLTLNKRPMLFHHDMKLSGFSFTTVTPFYFMKT